MGQTSEPNNGGTKQNVYFLDKHLTPLYLAHKYVHATVDGVDDAFLSREEKAVRERQNVGQRRYRDMFHISVSRIQQLQHRPCDASGDERGNGSRIIKRNTDRTNWKPSSDLRLWLIRPAFMNSFEARCRTGSFRPKQRLYAIHKRFCGGVYFVDSYISNTHPCYV